MTVNLETIENLKNAIQDNKSFTEEAYMTAEADLIKSFCDQFIEATVTCPTYGTGKVTAYSGKTLDTVIIDIVFGQETRRFSLAHIMTTAHKDVPFIKFTDSVMVDLWSIALAVHIELTTAFAEYKLTVRQLEAEAKKKLEAEKKAEAKYKQLEKKAIQDFEAMQNHVKEFDNPSDEFCYALGWLAKHIGAVTAILPDYLGGAFEKCFGTEAPKTLVDSRAKTSGGYAKQWSWEFKCTIKKLKDTAVPACIQDITTDFSKGIHNTAFLWDLVTDYGFRFGKKQDIEKIRQTIPVASLPAFEAGLAA